MCHGRQKSLAWFKNFGEGLECSDIQRQRQSDAIERYLTMLAGKTDPVFVLSGTDELPPGDV